MSDTGLDTLRQAGPADAAALFDAHQDSVLTLGRQAYDSRQLAVWFEGRGPAIDQPALSQGRIWLAERDGLLRGFVGVEEGEVSLLFVRAAAAGAGLGSRLLALGMVQARRLGGSGALKVVATLNSEAFYARHGFVRVGLSEMQRGASQTRIGLVQMQLGEGAP